MPYIVLAEKDREIDRRELTAPVVLGRSPECDISVRDILLSRRHCALEPFGAYWVIADLGSKNGTWLKGHRITRHVLAEGEVLRLGKIQLCFRAGAFIPAPPAEAKPAGTRAADPKEALAGTVAGFRFEEDEAKLDQQVVKSFPRPKPRPVAPKSYAGDQVSAMLADIVSSSWDNVLADSASRPARTAVELPKPILKEIPEPPAVVPAGAIQEQGVTATTPRRDDANADTVVSAPVISETDVARLRRRGHSLRIASVTLAWLWAILIIAGWAMHLPW